MSSGATIEVACELVLLPTPDPLSRRPGGEVGPYG